jgi:hypothetical protein
MAVALDNCFGGRVWRWFPAVTTCQSASVGCQLTAINSTKDPSRKFFMDDGRNHTCARLRKPVERRTGAHVEPFSRRRVSGDMSPHSTG